MPDPYAPGRSSTAREKGGQTGKAAFLARVRRLGATEEEVADLDEQWDRFDDDWTPEMQAALVAKRDRELREAIRWMHVEDETGTTTEEEAQFKATFEAPLIVTRPIREVLEWVGDEPIRAQAALDAERKQDRPRVTLIEDLERLATVEDDGAGT